MAQQNRRRCGNGKEGGNDRARGRCCGPGSPDSLPGCVRFRFCLWRKYLLKICSRYSTRAADEEGRGEGEAQQQQPQKLAQNLQMPQKKKKKEETKSGKKTRCQRQQRRYGDVDVSVGGSPCLTQLCTKFMIFYLSVQWERESSRAKLVGGGLGGSALRLHFP